MVGNGGSEKQKNNIEMEGNPCYTTVQKNAVELNDNLCYGILKPDPHDSIVIYETIT